MGARINKKDDKIINLERQINVNTQRARENNLEFHGVPDDVNDDSVQKLLLECCRGNIKIVENDRQGTRRLPKRNGNIHKPVIAKFVNRKNPELICTIERNLAPLDMIALVIL